MYILTKSNETTKAGILWIRIKDHPMAFPAYYYTSSNTLNKDLS
jgi:hypothetical protein